MKRCTFKHLSFTR